MEPAYVFALFKVEGIPAAAAADVHVHIFGGILGGAQTQTIETQRILITAALSVVVLTAGVHFTEHQLPVIPLFPLVKIHGDTSASPPPLQSDPHSG